MEVSASQWERWCEAFPLEDVLERYVDDWSVGPSQVSSPAHLVALEKLRRHYVPGLEELPKRPADLFLWSKSPPPDRARTQIGGLPYRPAGIPWPMTTFTKEPIPFVAQIRFVESNDITGPLPADVMLVFMNARWPEEVVCEWYPLGIDDLVTADRVPVEKWEGGSFWGHRYRTADYADQGNTFPSRTLAIAEATKIGGYSCFCYQEDGTFVEDGLPEALFLRGFREESPGRYFCRLNSIQPAPDAPFPWVDHETPIPLDALHDPGNEFMIGDRMGIDFFLLDTGQVAWRMLP